MKLSKNAATLAALIVSAVNNDLAGISLRNELKMAVQPVFTKPVTVAEAAAKLGLELSVKGLEKDAPERAPIQRTRVTLERALKDADRYLKVEGKGRKARTTDGVEGADEGEAGSVVVAALVSAGRADVNAILSALDSLSLAQLVRVQGKLAGLMASKQGEGKAEAKPARKPRKAKAA